MFGKGGGIYHAKSSETFLRAHRTSPRIIHVVIDVIWWYLFFVRDMNGEGEEKNERRRCMSVKVTQSIIGYHRYPSLPLFL